MAAVLTFESAAKKTEDWSPYIGDCRRIVFPDHSKENKHIGFEVGPPDINQSDSLFSVVFEDDEEHGVHSWSPDENGELFLEGHWPVKRKN